MRIFLYFPFSLLLKSNSILSGVIDGLLIKKRYSEAYQFCLIGLENGRNRKLAEESYWWDYLHNCLKLIRKIDRHEDRNFFIDIAQGKKNDGAEARLVASSFIELSRWSFKDKDTDSMIRLAKCAGEKDPSWGEPDFLIGWYGLFVDGIDYIGYFKSSITKERKYINRIKNDKECSHNKKVISFIENYDS